MQVDCSPTSPAGYIRAAQANSQVKVVDLLAELFDNSIDAGATRIEAEVSKKKGLRLFKIRDNGPGISGLAKLMLLGESDKAGGEQSIGRWGVGAKDCIFGVGGLKNTDAQARVMNLARAGHSLHIEALRAIAQSLVKFKGKT